MQMVPLLGLSPDIDPTTPGAMPDSIASRFIPTQRGIAGVPAGLSSGGTPPTHGTQRGHFISRRPDGTTYIYYAGTNGTDQRVYNAVIGDTGVLSGSLTDRSPAAYSNSSVWSFAMTADTVLAATQAINLIAHSSPTSNFAAVATPPSQIPKIVSALNGFAFAFNGATDQDRWWCSAINNPQDWAPSIATQATTGRLVGSGGPILAAAPLGDQMIAYKRDEIWVGSYVGPPEVWRWQRIPAEGVINRVALCSADAFHVFVGISGPWIFDGVRPVPLGKRELNSLFAGYNGSEVNGAGIRYDRRGNNVFFNHNGLVYNLISQKWGRVGSASLYLDGPTTYLTGGTGSYSYPSTSSSSEFRFLVSGFGAPNQVTMAREFRMLMPNDTVDAALTFNVTPAASIRAFNTKNTAATAATSTTDAQGRTKVDLRHTGYWHHFDVQMSGASTSAIPEVTAVGVDLVPAGMR